MIKKLICTSLMLFLANVFVFSVSLKAQDISIGPRLGLNWANVLDAKLGDGLSSKLGLVAGGVINYNFNTSEFFSLQAEILYMQQGYNYTSTQYDLNVYDRTRLNYIAIPVFVKITGGPSAFNYFALAGLQYGYLSSGSYERQGVVSNYSGFSQSYKTVATSGTLSQEDLKALNRTDIAVLFGLGIGVKSGPGMLQFEFRYGMGFNNLYSDNTYGQARNLTSMLLVAYLYPLGKK